MRRMSVEQRRGELIDAALRVIAREGLAAASTRAIVAEADMPLGALHYAFGSREELLAAVIERVTDEERLAAWIEAEAPGLELGIEAVLERGLLAYLVLLEADPSKEQVLLEVAVHAIRHDPDAVRAQWATYQSSMTASLEHAAALAGVRWTQPVAHIARSLNSVVDGLTLTWFTDRDGANARRHIALLARAFAALAEPDPGATKGDGDAH